MELLEKILERENLNEAYKRVYANKGASGVDGVMVEELLDYLKTNKAELLESIRTRKYKPQPVRRVEIPKDNGKKRQLGIPTVVDRVIQQAISQVLSPIYEKQFSNSSYGFRPNRSCEMAIIRSLELLNDGYDWVVDIDLERFFDTVHHDRLMNIIHRTIEDGDVLSLIRKFLGSGVMVGKTYEETTVGTPQGGNLSPLLSNIMLNELDKELEARGLHFVRYADDCNIFVGSRKAAERVMRSITDFIERKLGLKVNVTKSKVGRPNQIKFLGFGYFTDKNGKYQAKPHKLSIEKLKRKLKALTSRKWSIPLDSRLEKLKQQIAGWVYYFRIAKMKTVLLEIDAKLRKRVRVIIWKQWKRVRKRYKSLRKLGATHSNAWQTANCRKGYQYVCGTVTIHTTITNKRLEQRGLTSLSNLYAKIHSTTIAAN
ncbi:MAG TPA: group II intron reverse transcriptase/maturase [Caldisericia bacterium]|jgi:RNA-directed DNA polymerase|nr:group II intron reverse transcriptase/maturase [Caldisericia bacterium]